MSNLYALRAEAARLRSINQQLHAEANELANGTSRANRRLSEFRDHVTNTFSDSNHRIENSHMRAVRAYEIQGEIDRMYTLFKQMELANKRIREANNTIYYDFANYRTVRKIVQGMLDNLELNMVSDQTIYKSVERQHLETPDYWLTCVLISIMAWKSDDRRLADAAMSKALQLDLKSCAIFYMLFNLRLGRESAALKWFDVYQQCELKGSDEDTFLLLFSLISSTMSKEVDDRTKGEITAFIKKVIAMEMDEAGFSEEDMVEKVLHRLCYLMRGDDLEYNLLRRHCLDYEQISDYMCMVKSNEDLLQFFMDIANVSVEERNKYLNQSIESLVSAPNATEKHVYDEIARNENIIRHQGDVETADEEFAAMQAYMEADLDLISAMIDWVYSNPLDNSGQMQKNMFTLTLPWQRKAVELYAEIYRDSVTDIHPIAMGDYRTDANFADPDGERRKISDYCASVRDSRLARVKNLPAYIAFGVGVAAGIGAIWAGAGLLVVTAAAGIFGGVKLLLNSKQRKQIVRDAQLDEEAKCNLFADILREYGMMMSEYKVYDELHDKILEELDKF